MKWHYYQLREKMTDCHICGTVRNIGLKNSFLTAEMRVYLNSFCKPGFLTRLSNWYSMFILTFFKNLYYFRCSLLKNYNILTFNLRHFNVLTNKHNALSLKLDGSPDWYIYSRNILVHLKVIKEVISLPGPPRPPPLCPSVPLTSRVIVVIYFVFDSLWPLNMCHILSLQLCFSVQNNQQTRV